MTNYFELFDKRLHAIETRQDEILARLAVSGPATSPDDEPAIDIDLAASVLGIAKQTVYQRIKDIPHKRRFGRLYFFRSELLNYLRKGDVRA